MALPIFLLSGGAVIVAGATALVKQNSSDTLNIFLFWQRSERGSLVSKLAEEGTQSSASHPPTPSQTLQNVDDRYQKWVRNHLDALLGSQRYKQLNLISDDHYEEIELTPEERNINQNLGMSVVLLFGALLASVSTPWFLVLVFPMIITTMIEPLHTALMELQEKRKITLMSLLSINMIGIWLGGYFIIGGLGLVLYFLSNKFIYIAQDRSRHALVDIYGQLPQFAVRLENGEEVTVTLDQLTPEDTIVVRAGQVIPADGRVIWGHASIDQHMLTGESQPAEREVGDAVYASTIVLSGTVHLHVEHTGQETVAAQITDILNNTSSYQSSIEGRSIEYAESWTYPTLIAGLLAFPLVSYEAMVAILGAGVGLNVRITSPIAMLNFLQVASSQNILFKDGRSLDLLHEVDTIVFDKTGTLTKEQPTLLEVYPFGGYSAEEVLRYAAGAEHGQAHPIAHAILDAAQSLGLGLPKFNDVAIHMGYGLSTQFEAFEVHVGSWRFMENLGIALPPEVEAIREQSHLLGNSLVMVAFDNQFVGAIELEATIREEAHEVVQQLKERGLDLFIISGDQEQPTQALAQRVGIQNYYANVLPEGKADLIGMLQEQGRKVCFIGDGINDGIALKKAEVSVSLRGATSVAVDSAQIILMDKSLRSIPTMFGLGDEYHINQELGFQIATVPAIFSIFAIYFMGMGIAGSIALWNMSIIAGIGVTTFPLFTQRARERLQAQQLNSTRPQVVEEVSEIHPVAS